VAAQDAVPKQSPAKQRHDQRLKHFTRSPTAVTTNGKQNSRHVSRHSVLLDIDLLEVCFFTSGVLPKDSTLKVQKD
jgi:ribosomal protein L32